MIWDNIHSGFSYLWRRTVHGASTLNQQSQGWLGLLLDSLRDTLSFRSSLLAASIAYFTLFSVFPLILLTVAIASSQVDPLLTGVEQIIGRLEFVVPGFSRLLGTNLQQIVESRGAITRLSAITLIWSASSAFYVLTRALDEIWETQTARPAWRHRALAVLVTLAISLVLWTASFAWSVVVPIVNGLVPDRLIPVSPYIGDLGAAVLSISVFSLLYYVLPHTRLQWREVLVGAVIAGLLWEVAKRAFLFFVTNFLTLSNLVYGSVTAIIAFLTWAYISSLVFLFGAHMNVHYKRLRQDQRAAAQER